MIPLSSSRPISVQDIRQYTARESTRAKKASAAVVIARWYRERRLKNAAQIRCSIQRLVQQDITYVAFMAWLQHARSLLFARQLVFRRVIEQWRSPMGDTIRAIRCYERNLTMYIFAMWRQDYGVRARFIEIFTGDRLPDPEIMHALKRQKKRSVLVFLRARQVFRKCLSIGLESGVSIDVVGNKVPKSTSNPIWQGYLTYLRSFTAIEVTIVSLPRTRLLRSSFMSWWNLAHVIYRQKYREKKLREMELRNMRPFLKSWILLHRVRSYVLERAVFRWQLSLVARIRHVEIAKAAIELRRYALKKVHFNRWTQAVLGRELVTRHSCLEKLYGNVDSSNSVAFEFAADRWVRFALFFAHNFLDRHRLQATAFRWLHQLRSAVEAPRNWQRLISILHSFYYISRMRLYLRAWAFVTFKMKFLDCKQRNFCISDDIIFTTEDIQLLHTKHNEELNSKEGFLLMASLARNKDINLQSVVTLCQQDRYNCLLSMKIRRHILSADKDSLKVLYAALMEKTTPNILLYLSKLVLNIICFRAPRTERYNELKSRNTYTGLDDNTSYRQAMSLVQRNMAVRYHEFLAATDLLYSDLYKTNNPLQSEKKIVAYICGKFRHIRKALGSEPVVLLTTAFLLETPAIIFADRRSVISASFLIQTWLGNKQYRSTMKKAVGLYLSNTRRDAHTVLRDLHGEQAQPFIDPIPLVENVYFTGQSRDFNQKGVATLLAPQIRPYDCSITATERAILQTQLSTVKSRHFGISSVTECWLLGAIASASERELQVAALRRQRIYTDQMSRIFNISLAFPANLNTPRTPVANSAAILDGIETDIVQLIHDARSVPIDKYTSTLISTSIERVTADEMRYLIDAWKTSVVHPSLLVYINAQAAQQAQSITEEVEVAVEETTSSNVLDELMSLEHTVSHMTMRIIERSFSIAPLSYSGAGSFCMLPDEQMVNSFDGNLMQSSQLLSRQNSYLSPSFDQFSKNKKPPTSHASKRKSAPPSPTKSRGSTGKRRSKSPRTHSPKQIGITKNSRETAVTFDDNGSSKRAKSTDILKRSKKVRTIVTTKDARHSISNSSGSCQILSIDSFHIHTSDDYQSASARQRPSSYHKLADIGAYGSLLDQKTTKGTRPRSSYYSGNMTRLLSSGRASLGKPNRRPNTTAPRYTQRMNNSQRSSDTESLDDIRLQDQQRVDSAGSCKSCPGKGTHRLTSNAIVTLNLMDSSNMVDSYPHTIQAVNDNFTINALTHYQRSMLALHVVKRSSSIAKYNVSAYFDSIPELDIKLYARAQEHPIPALENIIDTVLCENIMFIYENEDPVEIFSAIWTEDPYFITGIKGADFDYSEDELRRAHFNSFWLYMKFLADEHIYEVVYELGPTRGDAVLRKTHSAPVLYTRMLQCSEDGIQALDNSIAESRPFKRPRSLSSISSVRSYSSKGLASQLTLDDLCGDASFLCRNRGSAPSQQTQLASNIDQRESNQTSPSTISCSIINFSMKNNRTVVVSVTSPKATSPSSSTVTTGLQSSKPYTQRYTSSQGERISSAGIRISPPKEKRGSSADISILNYTRYARHRAAMNVPQPLGSIALDESLLTVKARAEPTPLPTFKAKPLRISRPADGRFTRTIHALRPLTAMKRSESGRIGGLTICKHKEVTISVHSSRSTSRLNSHISRQREHDNDAIEPLSDTLDAYLEAESSLSPDNLDTDDALAQLCSTIVSSDDSFDYYGEFGSFRKFNVPFLARIENQLQSMDSSHRSSCTERSRYVLAKLASTDMFKRTNGYESEAEQRTIPVLEFSNGMNLLEVFSNADTEPSTAMEKKIHYSPSVQSFRRAGRSPKRPMPGLKVFCSPSRAGNREIETERDISCDDGIETGSCIDSMHAGLPVSRSISPTGFIVENLGPAVTSYITDLRQSETSADINLSLTELDDIYEYFAKKNYLRDMWASFIESMHEKYGDNYKNFMKKNISELLTVTSRYLADDVAPEKVVLRYTKEKVPLPNLLALYGIEMAKHATAAIKNKNQVVINAAMDYQNCLHNKSTQFKNEVYNSILHPKEISKRYEQEALKLASRVGSRASSRLGVGSRSCSSRGSSPLRPLRTSPGRCRDNLMVISVGRTEYSSEPVEELESTDIPIRVNEGLFGIPKIY